MSTVVAKSLSSGATRRTFFQGAAVIAGGCALFVAARTRNITVSVPQVPAPESPPIMFSEPLVAYIRNPINGEIAFMVGTQEIVRHDLDLVARLLKLAR